MEMDGQLFNFHIIISLFPRMFEIQKKTQV